MSIVLLGSTSGSITLQEPAVAGSNVINLPAATGTAALLQTPSFATTIGVGGATAASNGAGITFPAVKSPSTDANTLDDYEEGTWTPVVNGQNQSNCIYTKVGRLVTLAGDITLSFTGGAQTVLSGLPFTSTATSQYGNVITYQTVRAGPLSILVTNGSVFNFYDGANAQQSINSGNRIIFTITYFTS